MPELPEVETIIRDLNKKIINRKILDIWTDFPKIIYHPKGIIDFKKDILGKKIKKIGRRGKNIIIYLDGKVLLIHQKLTGHLLVGKWKMVDKGWRPQEKGPLEDKTNRFLHLIFFLDDGRMLALSDLRKFAKVTVFDENNLGEIKDLKILGPDALDKNLTFEKFKEIIGLKKGKIKEVLMNQEVIAGIGNIYSDEILWAAKTHPLKRVEKLSQNELRDIYKNIRPILEKAIKLRGDSMSDFRDTAGRKGRYQEIQNVYRQEGKPCPRCKTLIKRVKLGGRSAHFCPKCQRL